MVELKRYKENPILEPNPENQWEAKAVFNSAALYLKGKVYLIYRAQSNTNVSTFGLAISSNGYDIDERLEYPIYVPREHFELRYSERCMKNTGVEDPRVTIIDDRIYMLYTAVGERFDYVRVALTSISIKDFLKEKWGKWEKPIPISPPGVWDKDAAILPKRIKGKYFIFHRFFPNIWIDTVRSLDFKEKPWIRGYEYIKRRTDKWDCLRIGIGPTPIEVSEGWLVIYHGVDRNNVYKLGAMLLDKENPTCVISRLDYPILEPKEKYEVEGIVNNVVFSNGAVVLNDELFVYYGGADRCLCLATIELTELIAELLKNSGAGI